MQRDDIVELAKRMWGAYAIQANGKTFDGKPLPNWDELGEDRQACWFAAAKVSADRIKELEGALNKWLHYDCGPYDSGTDMTRDYLDALNATRAAMGWQK